MIRARAKGSFPVFDDLLRELRRLERGDSVSVSIPADEEGYLERECPSDECQFVFKILEDDWRGKVSDEQVFCPFCGCSGTSDQWWTKGQIEYAQGVAKREVERRIGGAMRRDAQRWNRRQPKSSFLSIKMDVRGARPAPVVPIVPELMRLKIECPKCDCRFAVVGPAFFCPACGHNAADSMFGLSIRGIRSALDAIPQVQRAIADRDTAASTMMIIVENSLQNGVTAFQRYAEALYDELRLQDPSLPRPRRNVFQNLAAGSEVWRAATGSGFDDYLSTTHLRDLNRFFQQRHLLAHRQGLVDEDYLTRSGDTTYSVGQRLVLREPSVTMALDLIEQLASSMEQQTR